MNPATSHNRFQKFILPDKAAMPELASLPELKSVPRVDDLDEDIQHFRVLYPVNHLPDPAPIPERRHPAMNPDRMVVSASMIRKIENELMHDECDPRTVFHACRGLPRGSLEFEEAYFAARVRSYAKHERTISDPLLCTQSNAEDSLMNSHPHNLHARTPPPPHPMAVIHLGHLMRHFGIWVIGLLGAQVFVSWRISAIAAAHLEGGRHFHFAVALFLWFVIDSFVWFRRRGNHCNAFFVPGIVLYLLAVLPVFILHVRAAMMATQ